MNENVHLIVVQTPLVSSAEEFLRNQLRLPDYVPIATVKHRQFLLMSKGLVAVADYHGRTLIWWCEEAAELASGSSSSLGTRFLERDPPLDFAALYVNDVETRYGFAVYELGHRVRCRAGTAVGLEVDEGVPLLEEAPFFKRTREVSRRESSEDDDEAEEGDQPELLEQDAKIASFMWLPVDSPQWALREKQYHRIGGRFVREFAARLIAGTANHSGLASFADLRWSLFGTADDRDEYLDNRRSDLEAAIESILLYDVAALLDFDERQLRDTFCKKLRARVGLVLGGGFDLQIQEVNGETQLLAYFRVARWWRSRNQLDLKLARKWAPDVQPGEMLGIRFGYRKADRYIFEKVLSSAEGLALPAELERLAVGQRDGSIERAAADALSDALDELVAEQPD